MRPTTFKITVFSTLVGILGLFWVLAACSSKPIEKPLQTVGACDTTDECTSICEGFAEAQNKSVANVTCDTTKKPTDSSKQGSCGCTYSDPKVTPTAMTPTNVQLANSCKSDGDCKNYCAGQCASPTYQYCETGESICYCGCY